MSSGQMQGLSSSIQGSNSLFDLGQTAYHTYKSTQEMQKGAEDIRNRTNQYIPKMLQYQQPYYDVGTQNAVKMSELNQQGAFDIKPFEYNAEKFNFQQDPGYQFQRQQGLGAINASAAAQGNMLSGATQKALARYGSGLAAQSYGQAYNRYAQDRSFGAQNALNQYNAQNQQATQRFGRYNQMAGMGQAAANNMSNITGQAMENMINADVGEHNAIAGGYLQMSKAWSQNFDNQSQIMSNMLGTQNGMQGGNGASSGGGGGNTGVMGGMVGGNTSFMQNESVPIG